MKTWDDFWSEFEEYRKTHKPSRKKKTKKWGRNYVKN